ncbi:MAG: hypothetical protein QF570_03065 [Myxococcota bacterium]|jgi:hypothetical protein|nr:hypothetical protein [Myxococcota bacterium]
MIEESTPKPSVDDPRKLSSLLARVAELSQAHNVGSVIVGLAAPTGGRLFPEFVEFLSSALRVEDGIFRMTRERAVVHLADLDMDGGQSVITRLMEEFLEEFPISKDPAFDMHYFLVPPGCENLDNGTLLKEIFPERLLH